MNCVELSLLESHVLSKRCRRLIVPAVTKTPNSLLTVPTSYVCKYKNCYRNENIILVKAYAFYTWHEPLFEILRKQLCIKKTYSVKIKPFELDPPL